MWPEKSFPITQLTCYQESVRDIEQISQETTDITKKKRINIHRAHWPKLSTEHNLAD
jgi:hypothetical protein